MDWFLMQYLNSKYALTLCESVKKVVHNFWQPMTPPKCGGLWIKLVHDVA